MLILTAAPLALASAGAASPVQLLRVGKFRSMSGPVTIDAAALAAMVENFKKNVKRCTVNGRTAVPLNYSHNAGGAAAGWLYDVSLSKDGKELWGTPEWTTKASQMINDNEFKFLSIEADKEFTDCETGTKHGWTLEGVALTNIPAANGMQDVKLQEGKAKMPTIEEVIGFLINADSNVKAQVRRVVGFGTDDAVAALMSAPETERTASVARLGYAPVGGNVALQTENVMLQTRITTLQTENATLKAEQEKATKNAAFEKLKLEGKACEAQRAAYLAGDMNAFLAAAVTGPGFNTNLATQPGTVTDPAAGGGREAAQGEIMKLAATIETTEKVDYRTALGLAMARKPELAALVS